VSRWDLEAISSVVRSGPGGIQDGREISWICGIPQAGESSDLGLPGSPIGKHLGDDKRMKINVGWYRRIGRKHEHRNTTGIVIQDLTWEDDHVKLRERLQEHRPEGKGWTIQGYCLAEE
jgi:hypothetical protein